MKLIMKQLVWNGVKDYGYCLEEVQNIIEKKYNNKLNNVDRIYIENKYIKYCLKCLLEEIAAFTDKFVLTEKTIIDKLIALNNIEHFEEITSPFKTLKYYELMMRHQDLIQRKETILMKLFKEECLKLSMNHSNIVSKEVDFLNAFLDFLEMFEKQEEYPDTSELIKLFHAASNEHFFQIIMDLDITKYGIKLKALQYTAQKLMNEKNITLMKQYKEIIEMYVKEDTIETQQIDNRLVLRVVAGSFYLNNLITKINSYLSKDSHIEEVHFICTGIMYINANLENDLWHGKNIVVYARAIRVCRKIIWNISGKSAIPLAQAKADTIEGDGVNGENGKCGESGGNVYIHANNILKPNQLCIVSNGGDGSDGQSGGDGVDGKNGVGISFSEFETKFPSCAKFTGYSHGRYLRTTLNNMKNIGEVKIAWKNGISCSIDDLISDGATNTIYLEVGGSQGPAMLLSVSSSRQVLMLYKGTLGKPGGRGGTAGLGGQGGYPGEVISSDSNIVTKPYSGKDGKKGTNGKYGTHGRNGWDIGLIDWAFWNSAIHYGKNENSQLKIVYYSNSADDRAFVPYREQHDKSEYTYAEFKHSDIPQPSSTTMTETESTSQQFKQQINAERKKNISQNHIAQYSQYTVKMDISFYRNLQSQMKNTEKCAYGKMMENKQQQMKEISRVHITRSKPSTESPTEYVDTSLSAFSTELQQPSEISITDFLTNLLQCPLQNWFVLNSKPLEYFYFDELFNHLEALEQMLKSNKQKTHKSTKNEDNVDVQENKLLQTQQLASIQELLMGKYHLAILRQIAIKMSLYQYTVDNQYKLTAKRAIKYFVHVKSNLLTNLGYCKIFGNLQQYFFEDTSAQRQNVSQFCTAENVAKYADAFKYSIGAFVMDEGGDKEAHSTIRKYYEEYNKYIGQQEIKLKQFYMDSKLDVRSFSGTIDRFFKSLNNVNAQAQLKETIKKDKQMKTLYTTFLKKFNVLYSWDNCLQDPDVFKNYVQHMQQNGPLSPSYRELLAYIFNINISIYIMNQDRQISLLDVHNPYSTEIVYLLYTNKKFTLLDINREYLQLDIERTNKANKSIKIITEMDNLKNRTECNDYLTKQLFFSKDDNEQPTSETAINEKQDMFDIIRHFPEEEKHNLRCLLEKISFKYIGQNTILHAIARCFTCDGKHITYNELYYLINAILRFVINDNPGLNVFCWIIMAYPQYRWINELILLKLENYFKKLIPEIHNWRNYLANIKNRETLLLLCSKLEHSKSNFTIQCIQETLYLLSNISEPVPGLKYLELSEWPYAIKEKYWLTKLSALAKWNNDEQLHRVSYYLLSLENDIGTSLVDEFMNLLTQMNNNLQLTSNKGSVPLYILGSENKSSMSIDDFLRILSSFHNGEWTLTREVLYTFTNCHIVNWITKMKEMFPFDRNNRDIKELVKLIEANGNTSKSILTNLNHMKDTVEIINRKKSISEDLLIKEIEQHQSKLKEYNAAEKKKYIEKNAADILHLINNAILLKKKFELYDTQKLAILTLLLNQKSTLMQMSTGEGKSLIVVALSIFRALCNEKTDIITSSSVLAKRDSKINEEIYKLFSVKVSHICEEDVQKRKEVYSSMDVIYGDLSSFQRDYLLDRFYDKNILGDRKFENVVIDEVDSMLLDKGNNMLYLSHDLPSLDKLESIYVYIWQLINRPFSNTEEFLQVFSSKEIRARVLSDLYGYISKKILAKINGNINSKQVNAIWEGLINCKIINSNGYLLQDEVNEEDIKTLLTADLKHYERELLHLFKEIAKRSRTIRVPNYLKPFIMLHLDSWINSAKRAMFMQELQDYVVDIDRTGNRPELNANITIIDRDTGTDQTNSHWDEGLHQFLQLKHGCKLSMQSLKAVFVSNVRYLKLYDNLYGLTGTLGSQRERNLLQSIYQVDFVTIPTVKMRRFHERNPIACSNMDDWSSKICEEAKEIIAAGRSILIICETVKEVKTLKNLFQTNVHTYTRDYESFDVGSESNHLCIGQIVIATNLAGRGTDIKITSKLNQAGGLHVCLTYMPNNHRVEQQAFGRAARCGNNGSGRLIILGFSQQTHSVSQTLSLKKKRDFEEILRISNIKVQYEMHISVEEDAFNQFKEQYTLLKNNLKENLIVEEVKEILLRSCLDRWAFWLDENSKYINNLSNEQDKDKYNASLSKFINHLQTLKSKDHENWVYWTDEPAQIIKLAKYFAQNKKPNMAVKLFDRVIKEEPYFSEIAHYYKAFALIKKIDKNDRNALKELKGELRQAATLMEEHRNYALLVANIIDNLKEKKPGILQINAFTEQQKNISILYQIILQSIDDIFGHNVTPQNFVKYDITEELAETLYNDLIEKKILKKPRVSKSIPEKAVKEISDQCGMIWTELNAFLNKYRGNTVDAKQFEKDLKKSVEITNKEDFWKFLVEAKVLTDEMKYVKINVKKLKNIDPTFLENIELAINEHHLTKEILKCDTQELLLNAIETAEGDTDEDITLQKKYFKNFIDAEKYKILKRRNVFTFNKKATFNKVTSVKFSSGDSITLKTFTERGFLQKEAQQILDDLIKCKVLAKEDTLYRLDTSYDKIADLKLDTYPIYEAYVRQLLNICFMYRIALQKLVKNFEAKVPLTLQLVTKPHHLIFYLLVEKKIIKFAKVSNNIDNLESKMENMYVRTIYGKNHFLDILHKNKLIPRIQNEMEFLKYAMSKGWIDILQSIEENCNLLATNFVDLPESNKPSVQETKVSDIIIKDFTPFVSSSVINAYYTLTSSERDKMLLFVDSNTLYKICNASITQNFVDTGFSSKEKPVQATHIKVCTSKFNSYISQNTLSKEVNCERSLKTIKNIIDSHDYLGKKATIKYLVSTIESLKNAFKTLDVPDCNLTSLLKHIETNQSFRGNEHPTEELHAFALNGLDHLLTLKEKPWTWKMILKTSAVIVMGIAQIVLGNVIVLLSAGTLSFFGSALISEGIGDIFFAVSAFRSGYFSWKSYARHKMLSVAISCITFGIGALYSTSQISSYGYSIVGPELKSGGQEIVQMGGKQIIKELTRGGSKLLTMEFTKRVALSTLQGAAYGLANMTVDYAVDNYLQTLCKNIGTMIMTEIDETVNERNMTKTLERVYLTLGRQNATAMIKEMTTIYFTPNNTEFQRICMKVAQSLIDAVKQVKLASSTAVTSSRVKILTNIIGPGCALIKKLAVLQELRNLNDDMLGKLDQDICAKLAEIGKTQTRNKVVSDPEDMNKFKIEIIHMWKTMLRERAGKVIDQEIVRPVMNTAAVVLVNYIGKTIQSTYETYKEREYTEQFKKYKQEHEKEMQELAHESEEVRQRAVNEYHNNLKGLLKKTCNPKLFADIILEGVPMDSICLFACLPVIQRVLAANGVATSGLTIIVKADSDLSERISNVSEGQDENVITINLEGEHYVTGNENMQNVDNNENNCLFNALRQQIAQLNNISADDFRKLIAEEIRTSPSIRERLSYGWHRYKIGVGLIGGRKPIRKSSISKEEKITSGFKMHDNNDVDLRVDKILNNTELQEQRTKALNAALEKIFEHLKDMKDMNRKPITFDIEDFQATKYDLIFVVDSENNVTLAYFPVEMKLELTVLLPKTKDVKSIIEININIDNPCSYKVDNGPQVPHVGFEVTGKSGLDIKERGHILINEMGNEYLPHRRPDNICLDRGEILSDDAISQIPIPKLFSGPSDSDIVLARNDPNFDFSDIKGKRFPSSFY